MPTLPSELVAMQMALARAGKPGPSETFTKGGRQELAAEKAGNLRAVDPLAGGQRPTRPPAQVY